MTFRSEVGNVMMLIQDDTLLTGSDAKVGGWGVYCALRLPTTS